MPDLTSQSGVIVRNNTSLYVPSSTIIAYFTDDGTLTTGNLGSFSFVTPNLSSGTIPAGATFGAGGDIQISAPGFATYAGSFDSATWQMVTLANGTHYYILTATLAANAGAFVLQTNNIGKGTFGQVASLQVVNIHLN